MHLRRILTDQEVVSEDITEPNHAKAALRYGTSALPNKLRKCRSLDGMQGHILSCSNAVDSNKRGNASIAYQMRDITRAGMDVSLISCLAELRSNLSRNP